MNYHISQGEDFGELSNKKTAITGNPIDIPASKKLARNTSEMTRYNSSQTVSKNRYKSERTFLSYLNAVFCLQTKLCH